jgi:hypothetical protein
MKNRSISARSADVSSNVDLKLDWCSHEAAKFACQHWHYSKKIPVNKMVKIGVWENNVFIGVVIFGLGASATAYKQYRCGSTEYCELVRIALNKHITPVTKIVSIAIKMMTRENKKLRVISSFADSFEGHVGAIYQGGNWIYTGTSAPVTEYFYNGQWRHATDVYKRLTPEQVKKLESRKKPFKYRYVMPLDAEMKKQVESLRKPYPKKPCAGSETVTRSPIQEKEGGSIPTPALIANKE